MAKYRISWDGDTFEYIHRRRAAAALGKPLPKGVEVHHADGSRDEHAPLVICQDSAYHKLLHIRMRVKAAGGDPNSQKICMQCRLVKNKSEFHRRNNRGDGYYEYCKACQSVRSRRNYLKSLLRHAPLA